MCNYPYRPITVMVLSSNNDTDSNNIYNRTDMIEMKFRVWYDGQMISPDYITRGGIAYWKENSIPIRSKGIEQYTGINDKKGIYVFVGDILILPDTESESVDVGIGVDVKVAETQVNTLAEVVMKNGAFGVEVYEAGEEWPKGFTAFINSDYAAWHADNLSELEAVIEICGNIHKDSHLLNKEQ